MVLTAALIAFHYAAVADIRSELNRVLPCAALGMGVDFTLAMTGVYDFGASLFPLWMVCLWFVFPTVLPRAMAFLGEGTWRPIILGAIAPANYLAGAKFGAVTLPLGDVTTMLILVPLWSLGAPS